MLRRMPSTPGTSEGLSIREVAAQTNITAHTLRYYERIGLVHPVGRSKSGHRRYGEADVRWLEFLKKLHATDMPIRKMLAYARLVRRGESTVAARRAMLAAHQAEVEAKLEQLRSSLSVIEFKIGIYDQALALNTEPRYVAATRR